MNCPKCLKSETEVVDSRMNREGSYRRRRHQCLMCKHRFSTFERRNDISLEKQLRIADNALQMISKERHGLQQTPGAKVANDALLKIMRAKITRVGMK